MVYNSVLYSISLVGKHDMREGHTGRDGNYLLESA